ncbi:MAG: cation-translocating P-type ATPase [Candidatus Micrarchaeia archaeon]
MNPTPSVEQIHSGLSQQEAQRRLKEEGANELLAEKKRTIIDIAIDTMREPMFLFLVACGTLYFLIGDIEGALMLIACVFVVIGITIYQEGKVERALDALRDLSSPRARVIRDGKQIVIPGREVVRGDIIILSEGDRVPADVAILSCSNLTVDESLLTGESVAVRKSALRNQEEKFGREKNEADFSMESMPRPGGEDLAFAYSSTLVSQGHAIAKVISIGAATEVGKIGKALKEITPEKTKLQKETDGIVKLFGTAGFVVCVIVIVIYGLTRGNWVEGFLVGLALAMSVLPEEFPVVLTVFLSLGAWRMAKHNVLTRRMNAIQSLGAASVLCSDKTGTLTQNKMTLEKIWSRGKTISLKESKKLPEWAHETLEYAVLASQKEPFDPMERSIKEIGMQKLSGTEHIHADWELVREYPLSKKLLALSHVWRSASGKEYLIAAKGAPEAILDLCHMKKGEQEKILNEVSALSGEGLRVLGVAHAHFKSNKLPDNQHDFEFEYEGLIALEDPVREEVADSVRECYEAGIRVIMITGDYPGTARVVAKNSGFKNYDDIITGAELDAMNDAHLRERIKTASVFARVVPEQKLRIVNALKANEEVVVMTGDGVNDAPALKAAAVGIAMGGRGTDVARESSALVLTDDNFTSIVRAVRMGRRIYDNIKKAMSYIISIHIPIAGISLLPVLLGWPIILFPVHIAFLELIIDPVCSVVFEAEKEEKNIMKRTPRKKDEKLFDNHTIIMSVFRGLILLAVVVFVYYVELSSGIEENSARAVAFATLVLGNLALIFASRSQTQTIFETLSSENKALWIVTVCAVFFLAMLIYVPFLQGLFEFNALDMPQIAICLVATMVSMSLFEVEKIVRKRK